MEALLKYAAEFEAVHPKPVSVAEMSPAMRFTRLGAVLRKFSTEPSDVGALARAAVTSPDHTPLFVLRDAVLDNPEHPLAKLFNWERLPEKHALDQQVTEAAEKANTAPGAAAGGSKDSRYGFYANQFRHLLDVWNALPGYIHEKPSLEEVDYAARRLDRKADRHTTHARHLQQNNGEDTYSEPWHDGEADFAHSARLDNPERY